MLQLFIFFPYLLLLLFSTFLIESNGQNNETLALCSTVEYCGNQQVRYPFWLKSHATDYDLTHCGYQGFGLDCNFQDGALSLQLENEKFRVQNISYNDCRVTLVDPQVQNNPECPAPSQSLIILEDLPLAYNRADFNLTFFFNCNTTLPFRELNRNSIDCLSSGGNASYVFDDTYNPEDFYLSGICEEKVVVAAVIDPKPEEGKTILDYWKRAMNSGFVLDWRADNKCSSCETSRGRCGFKDGDKGEEFLCFCNNGTTTSPDRCHKGRESRVRWKIAIGFGAAAGSALVTCFIFLYCMRRQKQKKRGSTLLSREISSDPSSVYDPETAIGNTGVHIFDYNELEQATNNFDSEQELGDGGFGTVYKGKLKDGRVVAVKRLYESNFKRVEHFINEVVILTRLRHQNLVTLYGCTSRHSRELLLVYEYVPNGTVADHLHGALAMPGSLPWSTRMRIAIETASALSYLHASDVIHRDVKTNNILLDADFHVKVADFGLSRLFPINATHISTAPQGTPGYVDPEYHECYHLTDKSDVFSFGVVLIELISSLPAVDITRHRHDINLSNMAVNKIQGNLLHELVDPNIGYESDYNVRMMITDVAELAFQSLQYGRDMRPSMQEVLETLMLIQDKDYSSGNTNGNENQADDVALLKARQLISSPNSVIEGIVSNTTTPNTSS
ncbi:OLC1v1014143C1 [Oldenlandia corymbosa var. corymbosa]|uniref:non-specific serine/threonine protein kinase n=1 Tax=Oldenlandia corymbosa var. corymbosa TaxID=529605 RepID=A0AAV1DZZ7_OLDCO|nr:OLC1v1014143C1 [Oldenlandia corymbosa var. corymbosa]